MNDRRLVVLSLGVAMLLAACGTTRQATEANAARPTALPAGLPSPWHDFTEAPRGPAQSTEYAIVTFKDLPVASYQGGTRGLERTKPERGRKLDPNSNAVLAYEKFLQNQHASYKSYLARSAPRASVVREYTLSLNGLAVKTNGASIKALASGPDVKAAAYATVHYPAMTRSLDLIGVTDLWRASTGLTGAGVKVAVIDSGIDDDHPFLACHEEITHRVYTSGVAHFGEDRVLVNDHGTHVAGTIAGCEITLGSTAGPLAGQEMSGVAPDAELHDFNVFPGYGGADTGPGGAFSHDIAQALEDAVRLGMDVANMSLGGSVQGPHDFLAEAVNGAVDAGMVVAVAAGNTGPGRLTVESPGSAENAITVGAVTNSHYIGVNISLSTGANIGGAVGDFDPFAANPAVNVPLAAAVPNTGCTAITSDVSGKIAIIDRGGCTFSTKIRNAQTAGAVGVLVVNNAPGDPSAMGTDGTANQPTIPALMVGQADRGTLLAAATSGATASINGENPAEIVTNNGGMLAGFSSRGPTAFTGIGKPDVVAPGVNIFSSVFDDSYAMFQGTSMATPHVSGAAALLLQSHGDWNAYDVKSALVITATRPANLEGSLGAGLKVEKRGNGLINVPAANSVPVHVWPTNASFGYFNMGGYSKTKSIAITVRSESGSPVACTASENGSMSLSPASFTADADGETLTVTLDSATARSGDAEGDITLSCGGALLTIPWTSYLNRPGPH
jgi:minor extracellular serine protease Vpr